MPRLWLALDPGIVQAARTGTLRVTYRVRFPEAGNAEASRNTFRLVDATGHTASSTAGFVLGGAATVARPRVRLTASTRRRLARSASGRLRLYAHRVSRDANPATAAANYATYNTRVTVRRTPKR